MGGGLAGCGPKSQPFSPSSRCDNASEWTWFIDVTGGRHAAETVEISVGETVQLQIGVVDLLNSCDHPTTSIDWQLTQPVVAAVSGTRDATLQGRSPGETGVRATVHAPNGTTASTTKQFLGMSNLIIRVVP
jgi:hypothetical protein